MFGSLMAAIGGALQIVGTWMKGYSDTKTTEARVSNDEQKKIDENNKAQAEKNLAIIRRDLADSPPGS